MVEKFRDTCFVVERDIEIVHDISFIIISLKNKMYSVYSM